MNQAKILGLALALFSATAMAQDVGGLDTNVIYRWTENGLVHYAKIPPNDRPDCLAVRKTGMGDCVRLNKYGLEIRVRDDSGEFFIIEPIQQPESPEVADSAPVEQIEQRSLDTERQRKKNCEQARENMRVLTEEQDAYRRDETTGNLIRLSNEEIEARRQQTEKDIAYYCD